ncbi:MAG: hypothetical protein ACP5N1_03745 [Candidatus Woesearchaeota archaeon]
MNFGLNVNPSFVKNLIDLFKSFTERLTNIRIFDFFILSSLLLVSIFFIPEIKLGFINIIAAHESLEYELVTEQGYDIGSAHKRASEKEIQMVKALGLKNEYLAFLKENYPLKVECLKEWKFV